MPDGVNNYKKMIDLKKLISVCIIFCFCILNFSFAQKNVKQLTQRQRIDSIFKKRGEIYFKFDISSKKEINILTKIISIDNVKNEHVFAYANRKEFKKFKDLGYQYEILYKSGKTRALTMATTVAEMQNWDRYPVYDVYVSMMKQFAIDYPDICKVEDIGISQQGRELLVAKISDNVNVDEDEPEFLYTGQMHGDEILDYIIFLRLTDYLLSNYGTNPKITNLINNIEIWINPLSNPDGTYWGGDNTVADSRRYLANDVDPNRNFPDIEDGNHPDGNAWAKETILMMDFADAHNFVMSANTHSGAEVANYPWDTWAQLHADDNWWQYVSREYADTVHINSPSGYFDDQNNGITNGYQWYTISGSRQDYMNYFKNCREVTLELSNTKLLDAGELPAYWNYNYRSMLNYLEESLYGVRGIVTDSITEDPLKAKVYIATHDADNSHVYSYLPVGDYHRPIYEGIYSITFSADGYITKTINNVSVQNESTTILDVQLAQAMPVADFTADNNNSCTGIINFEDLSSQGTISWLWDFGDGSTSAQQNPVHFYTTDGTFNVKLKVTNSTGSDSIIKNDYISICIPTLPVVNSAANCGSVSLTLIGSGNNGLKWYDSPTGGNLLCTGDTFITPVLDATTIYYLKNNDLTSSQFVGKSDNSDGGGYFNSDTEHFLVFDCYSPVKLISVKVYAQGEAQRTICLRNSDRTVIQSVTVNIPNGESRVYLNFDIPAGLDLQLSGPVYPNLYRSKKTFGSYAYPYELPGYISIKHSSAGSNPTQYYYYFYDWEVKDSTCVSPRVPVEAIINNGIPVADFDFSVNNYTVDFNDLSTDANTYFWNFGDGDTSNIQNPSHTYIDIDTYNVELIVFNACGQDTVISSVLVNNISNKDYLSPEISIFPNPSDGKLNIKIVSDRNEKYLLKVMNITGEELCYTDLFIKKGNNINSMDFSNYPKGIYLLKVCSDKKIIFKKVILY